MADGRFSSEDAALVALGNALLLNAFVAVERHFAFMKMMEKGGTSRLEDQEKARLLGTECRDLWEVLDGVGALDRRIDMPIDIASASQIEPVRASTARVNDLVNSDADIATLRLRDFPFPRWFQSWPGFRYALMAADAYELRAPLATSYASTKLVQALREPVLAYFNERFLDVSPIFARDPFPPPEEPEPAEAEAEIRGGGPRSAEDIAVEKRAQAALRAFAAANPEKRMLKREFCDALIAFSAETMPGEKFSGRAAVSVWDNAAPGEWTTGGRPGGGIPLLTADDLRPYLREALGGRSEGQGSAPKPPAGSVWEDLIKS